MDTVDFSWTAGPGGGGDSEVDIRVDLAEPFDHAILADAGRAGDDEESRSAPGA